MFGIGMQEIVLILVIALIVVGPKKLPEIATALGRAYAEFRRTFDDMKRNVETELHTEEIRRTLGELDLRDGAPAAPPPAPSSAAPLVSPSPYPEVTAAAPPATDSRAPETAAPTARTSGSEEDGG